MSKHKEKRLKQEHDYLANLELNKALDSVVTNKIKDTSICYPLTDKENKMIEYFLKRRKI